MRTCLPPLSAIVAVVICLVPGVTCFLAETRITTSRMTPGYLIDNFRATKKRHRQVSARFARTSTTVVKEELLEGEFALLVRDENPITTLTWFRGDAEAAATILEERLDKILNKNRWLDGRVTQERNKAFLTFDPAEHLNSRDFLTTLHPLHSPVRRKTPLDRLARDCKDLLMKNGPTESLFQVTLVPCRSNPKTHFALIVALSHIIADGHTYYKLMSMLCSEHNIEDTCVPLIYERITTTPQQQADAMGKKNYDFFAKPGPAFFLNYFGGILSARTIGPVNQCVFALVDDERMQEEKIKAASATISGDSSVDFVSTNDVLTSWFLQETKADVGAMAINFRDRLPDHTDRHAGNYESIIVYSRADSARASLIRKSLENYRRSVSINEPLPTFFESLGLKSGLVTNWSSFAKANAIKGCEEELHIPLYDAIPLVPTGTAVMIAFRAGPKGLGLYIAGSPDVLRGLGYSRQFSKRAPFLSTRPLL